MTETTLTPEILRDKLAQIYTTQMMDGKHVEPPKLGRMRGVGDPTAIALTFEGLCASASHKPYVIMQDGRNGQAEIDIREAVSDMLDAERFLGGTWCLMQWLDVTDAVAFADISYDDDELEELCDGDPSEYFFQRFKIAGFFRLVTPEIRMELNDCSVLQLVLKTR